MCLFYKQLVVVFVAGGILTGFSSRVWAQGPGTVLATGATEFSVPAASAASPAIAGGGTYAETVGDIPWANELTGTEESGEGNKAVPTVDWNNLLKWGMIILAVAGLALGVMALLNKDKGSKGSSSSPSAPCNKDTSDVIPEDLSCEGVTCQNGGTCVNGSCNCPAGYYGSRCENSTALGGGYSSPSTVRNPEGGESAASMVDDPLTAGDISDDEKGAAAAAAQEKARNATAANYAKAKRSLQMGSAYPKTTDAVNADIQNAETWRDSFGAVIQADSATYDESARFLTVLTDQANQITTDIVGSGRLVQIEEVGSDAAAPAPDSAETKTEE